MRILAGREDRPAGSAAMEITFSSQFARPIPRAHDDLDEAIYLHVHR
jgi:hypothetical protein